MTELATPPTEQSAKELTRISHWIGGATVEGTSGRTGPVYNPAARRAERRGRPRDASRRSAPRSAAAKAAFPAWRATSLAKRAELMFRIRELVARAPRGGRPDPHRRARQGALRRDAARSRAGSR